MHFGFVVPYADAREFSELALIGEQRGWDGVFSWEALYGVDAWVSLGAAAMVTERVRLGTILTPVPRIRPWDLATRVGTVDQLSGGRVILGAGLGALHEGWTAYEADEGRKVRAEKLDEGLAVYAGLLGGQPFEFEGKHYQAKPNDFMLPDPPVQQPHPPVWVVGAKVVGRSRQRSLERAARWQGLLPYRIDPTASMEADDSGIRGPEQMAELVDEVKGYREDAGLAWEGYDVVLEADSFDDEATPIAPAAWAEAGVTWWVESCWDLPRNAEGAAELRRRVEAGPPDGCSRATIAG